MRPWIQRTVRPASPIGPGTGPMNRLLRARDGARYLLMVENPLAYQASEKYHRLAAEFPTTHD